MYQSDQIFLATIDVVDEAGIIIFKVENKLTTLCLLLVER